MEVEKWAEKGKMVYALNRDIFVIDEGKSENTLVILHGYGSSSIDYYKVLPELSKHYRVIIQDFAGFGFSDRPEGISYDMEKGKGTPFSYFTTGNSFVMSEIDILSGMSRLIEVFITHEGGNIIDEAIDKGQIAGGFMQGYVFATMEDWVNDEKGKPLSTSFSTYKVPLISDYPEVFSSELLVSQNALSSVFGSKGVGEPPLLYGLAGFMAIRDAIESTFLHKVLCRLKHPATCENVLMEIERIKNEAS